MQESTHSPHSSAQTSPYLNWIVVGISLLVVIWFYLVVEQYGAGRGESGLGWVASAWNSETDYEHGFMVPLIIAGLIFFQRKELSRLKTSTNLWGLFFVFVGIAFYAAGYRTLQPRVTVGSLPFILWGGSLFLWGWPIARLLLFPLFFFWLAIPLPSFQQATTGLQLMATLLAHHGSGLFGVDTRVVGTTILPIDGDWKPLDIATGCSGIRSLMALLMISSAWAYVAKIKLWQKAILLFAALPLAIVGNALRVTSIFVIAEYGNAEWAAGTWHDWSGMLLFYPFSLTLLLALHSFFEGGIPWKKSGRRRVRRKQAVASDLSEPPN